MPADFTSELDRAYEELRGIDSEIATLSGRSQQDRMNRRRVVVDPVTDSAHNSNFNGSERRVVETSGNRRLVVTTQNNAADSGYQRKRPRFGYITNNVDDNDDDGEDYGKSDIYKQRNGSFRYEPPAKRQLQSSVVMPTIETKSRAEILTEMKKSEKKEDTVRNQRLFSNLVVGTLKQFQKEEGTVKSKIKAQTEKQREIERRLELTEKENRDRLQREKRELLDRRRVKEREILRLKREKAIIKHAEEKEEHFHRLQCFIQTQTKPPIFFLPAKHTLRTLELLKESAKKVEGLITLNREKMASELQRDRLAMGAVHHTGDGGDSGTDEDDLNEDIHVGVKSAVVAVSNPVTNTAKDEKAKSSEAEEVIIE